MLCSEGLIGMSGHLYIYVVRYAGLSVMQTNYSIVSLWSSHLDAFLNHIPHASKCFSRFVQEVIIVG